LKDSDSEVVIPGVVYRDLTVVDRQPEPDSDRDESGCDPD